MQIQTIHAVFNPAVCMSVLACICMYFYVYACIRMKFSRISQYNEECSCRARWNFTCAVIQFDTTWFQHRKSFFYFFNVSAGLRLVVDRPNHGPGVDVEEGTSRSRWALIVALAPRIASFLAAVHTSGNSAVAPRWNQWQFPEDVREWNNVQDRFRGREVQ